MRLRLSGTAVDIGDAMRQAAQGAGFLAAGHIRNYHSIAINLRKGPEALLQGMNGKWRTDLRFAQKSGLELEWGQGTTIEARFTALFREVQDTKGFSPISRRGSILHCRKTTIRSRS